MRSDPSAVQWMFANFHRARAAAEAAGDDAALLDVAMVESDTLLQMANFASAEEVALRGLHAARRVGLDGWFFAAILVGNAADGAAVRGAHGRRGGTDRPADHWAAPRGRLVYAPFPGRDRHAARRHLARRQPATADRA